MLVRDIQRHIIGNIDKGVFTKMVSGKYHFLRNPEPSIAIDAVAFDSVISLHAGTIRVVDRDTKQTYSIKTPLFKISMEKLNRGYGWQYYVPIKLWDRYESSQIRLI